MPTATLPEPNVVSAKHSQQCYQHIVNHINANGPMSFADYMQLALYAPGLGYYSAGNRTFGPEGDFITAPEISPLFSRCLARQCQQVLELTDGGDILEFGAGSGTMAGDLLMELQSLNCLPNHYYILEVSAALKQRQQTHLQEKLPDYFDNIIWLQQLSNKPFKGIMLANEVIDAMPVNIFRINDQIDECFINLNSNAKLTECWQPASKKLQQAIKQLNINFPAGYQSEINLNIEPWIASLANILQQGLILIIDYGFPRQEYYHPQRNQGTLMCHFRHHNHSNPLIYPGIQDITAHVDFTAIAEAADKHQLDIAGYANQTSLLLSLGITDIATTQPTDPAKQWEISQQIKRLTLPSEMGELFKAIALTKLINQPLISFNLSNMLHSLSVIYDQ